MTPSNLLTPDTPDTSHPQYGNHKGWPSLVAGLPPVLGATAVSQALYFYLYSNIRQNIVVSPCGLFGAAPES